MKIKNLFKTAGLFIIGMGFATCDLINPDEKIPAYLQIDEISVEPASGVVAGTLSSNITQARVTIPDPEKGITNTIGTFSLPATVPVLLEGDFEILVEPVIKANGNSFSLVAYPFYERIITQATLVPGEFINLELTTRYKEDSELRFEEDFESGSAEFFNRDLEPQSPNKIIGFEDGAFEGTSGKIALNKDNAGFNISTDFAFPIDLTETGLIYLEMNYKTDIPIEVGIIGINGIGEENYVYEYVIFESEEWNKIYLNLTELIQFLSEDNFRFVIRGVIPFDPATSDFSLESAEVLLDNIKLIHF